MHENLEAPMTEEELVDMAECAYEAIGRNTGTLHWQKDDGLLAAYDTFDRLFKEHQLAWLIDAASGSGMTHLGLLTWLRHARRVLGLPVTD